MSYLNCRKTISVRRWRVMCGLVALAISYLFVESMPSVIKPVDLEFYGFYFSMLSPWELFDRCLPLGRHIVWCHHNSKYVFVFASRARVCPITVPAPLFVLYRAMCGMVIYLSNHFIVVVQKLTVYSISCTEHFWLQLVLYSNSGESTTIHVFLLWLTSFMNHEHLWFCFSKWRFRKNQSNGHSG